eukprot:m.696059 g.696059  ORF g.696059 m.696059 type:complete len:55 (-) comp22891_c0_seq3:2734-2898(-)
MRTSGRNSHNNIVSTRTKRIISLLLISLHVYTLQHCRADGRASVGRSFTTCCQE